MSEPHTPYSFSAGRAILVSRLSSPADSITFYRTLTAWKSKLGREVSQALLPLITQATSKNSNFEFQKFQSLAQKPLASVLDDAKGVFKPLRPADPIDASILEVVIQAFDSAVPKPSIIVLPAHSQGNDVNSFCDALVEPIFKEVVAAFVRAARLVEPTEATKNAAIDRLVKNNRAPTMEELAKILTDAQDASAIISAIDGFVLTAFELCAQVDPSGRRFIRCLAEQEEAYVKNTLLLSAKVSMSALESIASLSDDEKRSSSWKKAVKALSRQLYDRWDAERAKEEVAKSAKSAASKAAENKVAALKQLNTRASDAATSAAPTAASRLPTRPCIHCQGNHWDSECASKGPSSKGKSRGRSGPPSKGTVCAFCGKEKTVENEHVKDGRMIPTSLCPLGVCVICKGTGHLAVSCPLSVHKEASFIYSHVCVPGSLNGQAVRVALDSCAGTNLIRSSLASEPQRCSASISSLGGSSHIALKAWVRVSFPGGILWEGWCALCDQLPFENLDILLGTQAIDSLRMDLGAPNGNIRLRGQLVPRLATSPPLDLNNSAPQPGVRQPPLPAVVASNAASPWQVSIPPAHAGIIVDATAAQFGLLLAHPSQAEAQLYAVAKQRTAIALINASSVVDVRNCLDSFLQDVHHLAPQRLASAYTGMGATSASEPHPPEDIARAATQAQVIRSVDLLGEGDPTDSFPEELLDAFAIPDDLPSPIAESVEERRSWAKQAAEHLDRAVPQEIRDEYEAAYFLYSSSVFRPASSFQGGQLVYPPIRAVPDKSPDLNHCWGRPFKPSLNPEDAQWMEEKLHNCVKQGIVEVLPPGSFDPLSKRFRGTALMAKRTPLGEATKRRLVVDFTLSCNRCFEKPKFDMNYIRGLMKEAGLVALFSLDDGVQQFHQFSVAEEDRDVFAFDSPLGWTRFRVMPMGWTRSPYECVLGLNIIFACFGAGRLWRYMDELLRMTHASNTLPPVYRSHLQLDLDFWLRCKNVNLLLSREKIQHAKQEMTILSLVFGHGVVKKPASFIKGMASLPEPRKMTDLRYALRVLEYLSAMSLVRKPIHLLSVLDPLLKIPRWSADTWDPEVHGKAWSELVRILASEVALRMPRFDRPMEVTGDWSKDGLAFCITQEFDEGPGVIAVFARKTKGAEKWLDAPAGEAAWMAEAVLKAGDLLEAAPQVRFITDADALARLSCEPFDPAQPKLLMRSYLKRLQRLRFDIVPKKGTQISHIDALTRAIAQARQRTAEAALDVEEWHLADQPDLGKNMPALDPNSAVGISKAIAELARDRDILIPDPKSLAMMGQPVDFDALADRCPEIAAIKRHVSNRAAFPISGLLGVSGSFKNRLLAQEARYGPLDKVYLVDPASGRLKMHRPNGPNHTVEQLVIPSVGELRARAVMQFHGDPSQGHFDWQRSKEALRKAYTWPSDSADLKALIDACDCKRAKHARQWQIGPPGHLPPSREFDEIIVDWIGPFNPRFSCVQQKTWIFHMRDARWGISFLKKTYEKSAKAAVAAIVKRIYQQAGMLPRVIQSDSDTSLSLGEDFKRIFGEVMGAITYAAAPYYPQYQTIVERPHSSVKVMLRMLVARGVSIEDAVGSVEQALHSAPSPVNGNLSTFAVRFGYEPITLFDRVLNVDVKDPHFVRIADKLRSLQEGRLLQFLCKEREQTLADRRNKGRWIPNPFKIGDSVFAMFPGSKGASKLDIPAFGPFTLGAWDETQHSVAILHEPDQPDSILRVHVSRLVRQGQLPPHLKVNLVRFSEAFPPEEDSAVVPNAEHPHHPLVPKALSHSHSGIEADADGSLLPPSEPLELAIARGEAVPPPPEEVDGEEGHFEVESIHRHVDTDAGAKQGTFRRYLVKWVGYPLNPNNEEDWVDAEELGRTAPDVMQKYEEAVALAEIPHSSRARRIARPRPN